MMVHVFQYWSDTELRWMTLATGSANQCCDARKELEFKGTSPAVTRIVPEKNASDLRYEDPDRKWARYL